MSDDSDTPYSWSPDGKVLAYAKGNQTIWILPLEGDRKPHPFVQTSYYAASPRFSTDGHWLAYSSEESGGPQVYVQPYPGPGGKWQVSTAGGNRPQWNPNNRELFYRNGDTTMVVDVTTSPTFTAGKPRVLYQGPEGDVSRDAHRFLAMQPVELGQPPTQINVVLNWFEELKRRVPPGK